MLPRPGDGAPAPGEISGSGCLRAETRAGARTGAFVCVCVPNIIKCANIFLYINSHTLCSIPRWFALSIHLVVYVFMCKHDRALLDYLSHCLLCLPLNPKPRVVTFCPGWAWAFGLRGHRVSRSTSKRGPFWVPSVFRHTIRGTENGP